MCNSRQVLRPVMVHSMLIGLTRRLTSIDSAGSRFLSYPERPDQIWGSPSPLFMSTRSSVSGDKPDHSSRNKARENVLSYKSTLVHFHGVVLVNHRKLNVLLLCLCVYIYRINNLLRNRILLSKYTHFQKRHPSLNLRIIVTRNSALFQILDFHCMETQDWLWRTVLYQDI